MSDFGIGTEAPRESIGNGVRVGGSILGTRVLRIEDPEILRHGGNYSANLRDRLLDGALHAVFVRSPLAHAVIGGINTAAALDGDGVVAVITAADLDVPEPAPSYGTPLVEPYLATDRVRYVGQAVAIVVAKTLAQAVDAAEFVTVDYEPLPAVADPVAAARDETLLFPEIGTNILDPHGEVSDHFFDGCEVVITADIVNNRMAAAPLEGRAGIAVWRGDAGAEESVASGPQLTMWLPNQGAQLAQRHLAQAFGIDRSQVHVKTPDVGGAFGAKFGAEPDHIAIAAAARMVGRPVRWVETRSENLTGMVQGRGQHQTVTLGGTRDGRLIAYRLEVLQDCGAYPRLALDCVGGTRRMAPGVYALERLEIVTRGVLTTTTPVGAFRGAGRPEATAAIERAVDLFAAEIGMDPAHIRRRNMLPAFTEPVTSLTGAVYDCGDYQGALTAALTAAKYDELRADQAARRTRGDVIQLGIGLSTYVEITGGGKENSTVTVHPDGSATVTTGVSPHGQGHATAWAMIVSDRLGIPIERINLVWGDTALVPRGGGTGGSRSLQMGGTAAQQAADDLIDQARQRAAQQWEIDPKDVIVSRDKAGLQVAGIPDQLITFADLAANGPLRGAAVFSQLGNTYPFGAHVAVVEVDLATGQVRLRDIFAADDAGRIMAPLLADGQRHGGLAQGIAQALFEEALFDAGGNPITATFADYHIPTAADLPHFTLLDHQTPTPLNALGAKGLGEASTIGATPAVHNAVIDAVAHLGIRHIDMPLTPARVWQAIAAAR